MGAWKRAGIGGVAAVVGLGLGGCGAGQGSDSNPAVDDVNIAACALSAEESKGPEALLNISNKSTKNSTYAIVVKFVDRAASTVLDRVTTTAKSVAPGQMVQIKAVSEKASLRQSNPQFLCDIDSATRVVSP